MDEPWDSEHNKKLIARMPIIFHGLKKKLNQEGKTSLVAPVGKGTMFPADGNGIRLGDVTDGLSNTIMTLRANDESAVIWTKPDDLEIDMAKLVKGLDRPGEDSFLVVMGDGSVRKFRLKIDPTKMAALLTRRSRGG